MHFNIGLQLMELFGEVMKLLGYEVLLKKNTSLVVRFESL